MTTPNMLLKVAIAKIAKIERELESLRANGSCEGTVMAGKLQQLADACQDGFDAILAELDSRQARAPCKLPAPMECCVQVAQCHSGRDIEWYTVEVVAEGKVLDFCPRHALAAEALTSLGMNGHDVILRLRAHERD